MLIIAAISMWVLLTLVTLVTALKGVITTPSTGAAEQLENILATLARVSTWQNLASILTAGALFAGFFGSALETSIWPWPILAWVVLWLQLLWLRPHLAVYVDFLRRNVERPVHRLLLIHVGFDVVTLACLLTVLAFGLR